MSYIDNRLAPSWLPQLNINIDYVLDALERENITSKRELCNPKTLKPTQKLINKNKIDDIFDKITNNEPFGPVFIDADNYIIDGHHRCYACLKHPDVEEIEVVKLFCDVKDGARVLNKIMDRYDFDQQIKIGNFDSIQPYDAEYNLNQISVNRDNEEKKEINLNYDFDLQNDCKVTCYSMKGMGRGKRDGNICFLKPTNATNIVYDLHFNTLLKVPQNYLNDADNDSVYALVCRVLTPAYSQFKSRFDKNNMNSYKIDRFLCCKLCRKANIDGVQFGDKFILAID